MFCFVTRLYSKFHEVFYIFNRSYSHFFTHHLCSLSFLCVVRGILCTLYDNDPCSVQNMEVARRKMNEGLDHHRLPLLKAK